MYMYVHVISLKGTPYKSVCMNCSDTSLHKALAGKITANQLICFLSSLPLTRHAATETDTPADWPEKVDGIIRMYRA